ncbi:MAG: Fur family transcriptional regulator [Anaerolineaceae bacterium]
MIPLIEQLHSRGFRVTNQRLAVFSIVNEAEGHLSAIQIYQRALETIPGVTESTIYRTLDFLSHQGLALVAHIGNGHLVYESAERNHLHAACERCGNVIELDPTMLSPLSSSIEKATGYRLNTNHFTFLGTCPACQELTK